MGSNTSRPSRPPPADGASSAHTTASTTAPTSTGSEAMDVDDPTAAGSHRQLAGRRRARAVSAATTGTSGGGSSSGSSSTFTPGSGSDGPSAAAGGNSTLGSFFHRRPNLASAAGGGGESSGSPPRRKDPKRRRLSGLLSPRGSPRGGASGSSSAGSERPSSSSRVDKGKQRERPSRSAGFLDGEFTPTDVDVAPAGPPVPVTSSSTEPIDRPSSASRIRPDGMLGDDTSNEDEEGDGSDPLASPRRRAARLIERVSMESLRSGLGTAAYVNPLPDATPIDEAPSSAPGSASEQTRAEVTRASDLLSSVLGGYPAPPQQRPSTPLAAAAVRPPPPSPTPGEQPTPATAHRPTHGLGGGTSMVVQGLVTTSRPPTPPPADSRTSSPAPSTAASTTGRPLRPLPSRLTRSSSAATASTNASSAAPPTAPAASTSEEQAALLGGLLSVATTATASSLMRSPRVRPPVPSPSGPTGSTAASSDAGMSPPTLSPEAQRRLAEIRNALRQGSASAESAATADAGAPPGSGRPEAAAPSANEDRHDIETVLREYMQGQFGARPTPTESSAEAGPGRPRASTPPADPTVRPPSTSPAAPAAGSPTSSTASSAGSSTDSGPAMPHSFEIFLDSIQVDLLRALREYNGLSPEPDAAAAATDDNSTGDSTAATVPLTADVDSSGARLTGSTAGQAPPAPSNARPAVTGGVDGAPLALNFMMAYRFPSQMAPTRPSPAAGGIPADPRPSSTAVGAQTETPQANRPLAQLGRTLGASTDASQPTLGGGAGGPPLGLRRVTPMIVVGVRSVSAAEIPAEFGQAADQQAATPTTEPATPGPAAQPTSSRAGSTRSSRDADGDSVMSDVSTATRSTAGEGLTGRVRRVLDGLRSRVSSSTMSEGADRPGANSRAEVDAATVRAAEQRLAAAVAAVDARRRGTQSFVLWVIGGRYEDGNPILTAPGLLTGQMTHEELWALAEIIGNHKPPTATAEDISKAALEVIRGSQVADWVATGRVIASSADRCAICLDDYEADQDCRVMSCKHIYHQPCIDSWLSTGRNACPACRTKGVPTAGDNDDKDGPVTAAAAADQAANVAAA